MNRVEHTLEPVYDENSLTLILGSMPSETSRMLGKYYGHKSNRFWLVMSKIYDEEITDWKKFILKHNLALWDVISECDITGSSDASIKNVKVNDIKGLLEKTRIQNIFVLGKSAFNLYNKYLAQEVRIPVKYLPSSSSANASYSEDMLIKEYKIIRDITETY